jgi:hypothetical protein
LETFSGVDVNTESLCLSDNISVGVYHLEGRHIQKMLVLKFKLIEKKHTCGKFKRF